MAKTEVQRSDQRQVLTAWSLLAPGLLVVLTLAVIPLLLIARNSVGEADRFGRVSGGFTFENFAQLADPVYAKTLAYSLGMAALNTVVCLLVGYVVSYYIVSQSPHRQPLLLLLIIVPFWTDFLVRTFAWITLLGSGGPVIGLLHMFGVGGGSFIPSQTAVPATPVSERLNPARAGSAYGYVDMGGWLGGQADFVMVPFADFNLLKFPDRDAALAKIRDLTMLSDIFPTGYHGAKTAGVTTGSTVYVAGAGPVGLAAAYSAQLLGAAVVIVGDLNADRLKQAESFGCETVDISADATLEDQIANILNTNEVDCAVDAVGFEASGHGHGAGEQPAAVLNSIMT